MKRKITAASPPKKLSYNPPDSNRGRKDKVEEKKLEALVFGSLLEKNFTDSEETLENESIASESDDNQDYDQVPVDDLFIIDTVGGDEQFQTPTVKQPVWNDVDDVKVDIQSSKRLRKLKTFQEETIVQDYESRLRKQFTKLHPTPAWATRPVAESEVDSFNIANGILSKQNKTALDPDFLPVLRLKDANQSAYSEAVIQVVEFHPSAPVLLTIGYDKTLRLFQVFFNAAL